VAGTDMGINLSNAFCLSLAKKVCREDQGQGDRPKPASKPLALDQEGVLRESDKAEPMTR
ncbi:MAG: hypothetical protein SNJ50_03600, partial [Cyanobacteriota bacterium]